MILELDGSFYETYPRKVCAGCFFKADICTLNQKYRELECIDENGHACIWRPINAETVRKIISSSVR